MTYSLNKSNVFRVSSVDTDFAPIDVTAFSLSTNSLCCASIFGIPTSMSFVKVIIATCSPFLSRI